MDLQAARGGVSVVGALDPGEQRPRQPVGLAGPQRPQRRERLPAERRRQVRVGEQDERGQVVLAPDDAVRVLGVAGGADQAFLAGLNATPTVAGVRYTVIESTGDEVVTPYRNAFLPAAPNVTNITVQHQCALDGSDHLEIAADPVALADVLNALDPAAPVKVPCLVVLPLTGPVGTVPDL